MRDKVNTAKPIFWKEVRQFDPGRWHAFDIHGETFCGRFALIGVGKPQGARVKAPQTKRCGACLAKLR